MTQATYDHHRAPAVSLPVDQVTVLDARQIYLDDYWTPARCAELPPRLGLVVFDVAVNSSVPQAVKTLQRTVNPSATAPLVQDGVFGPKTMQAVDNALALYGHRQVVEAFLDWRELWYERLAQEQPQKAVFLPIWKDRLAKVRRVIEVLPE